jgi:hypothetical protein
MRWHHLPRRAIVTAASVTILLVLLTFEPALAHGGHAHAEEEGAGTVILQVAGTAVALGVIVLMASRAIRWHDDRRQ